MKKEELEKQFDDAKKDIAQFPSWMKPEDYYKEPNDESSRLQKLVMSSESSSGAVAGKIDKITLEQAHQLADSIIGKLYRRGYIEEHRKDEGLLKQIIVQHFYELK